MGKEGSRGPAWGGRQEGLRALCGPFFSLKPAARRARLLRCEDARTSSRLGLGGSRNSEPWTCSASPRPGLWRERREPPGARPCRGKAELVGPGVDLRGWPGRRLEAEEFSVERGFVSSRFQSNSSQSSQNSPSEERKVRGVQAGYPDSAEAEHHFAECRPSPRVGRDGNLAEGRSCLVKGDSRDTGEGASLFPVRRRGAKRAVGWGGRAVALSILLGEMGFLPRELRWRRLGHVLPQESLRLGLRACTLGRNLKMSRSDHFVLQRRKRRFGA